MKSKKLTAKILKWSMETQTKMSKIVVQTGIRHEIHDKKNIVFHKILPVGTYIIQFDKRGEEFYLEKINDFVLPKKIYGKADSDAKRIMKTFLSRSLSTGVLLSGIKGAGKTLLAKQVSVLAKTDNIPTIIVNKDWHGDTFNAFIQSIESEAIVIFDEFEKIYGWDTQRKVLTLLDGVFPTKKLFIITTNRSNEVSEFLINRPGRIYYNFKFNTLGQDFIKEFCQDNLKDKSQIKVVLKYTSIFSFFNFDMLNAAVEEMNRYGESLTEVIDILNIEPEMHDESYKLSIVVNDKEFIINKNYNKFKINNFVYDLFIEELPDQVKEDKETFSIIEKIAEDEDDDCIEFNSKLIKSFNQPENKFVYEYERSGHSIELHIKRNEKMLDWKFDPRAI